MHHTEDFLSRLRYMHIMALKPLYERLHNLLVTEDNAKAQRARLFPRSSQGWREMDTRDAKLKVAKFLLMDKRQQDEMIYRELAWRDSKADIDRVLLEYKSNVRSFKSLLFYFINLIKLDSDYVFSRSHKFYKRKPVDRSSKEGNIACCTNDYILRLVGTQKG